MEKKIIEKSKKINVINHNNKIDKKSLSDFFKKVNKKNKKAEIKNIVILSEMYLHEDMSDLEFEHLQMLISSDFIDQLYTIGDFKNHINVVKDLEIWKNHANKIDDIMDEIVEQLNHEDNIFIKVTQNHNIESLLNKINKL